MEVRIERLDDFGRGITYINNKICFVENALPNELVEIEITEEHKKYLLAKTKKYIEKSISRIEEECPYSSICGGCNLNHMCFNDENQFKKNKVKKIIEKFTNNKNIQVEGTIHSERNHYRNKIVLHGKDEKLGLYKKETNEIIPIQECLLVNDKINELIRILHSININIEEVTIKTSNDNSKVLMDIKGEVDNISLLKNICDVLIINDNYINEETAIMTNIGNKKYYESSKSFFQVNNTLTKDLYDEVRNLVSKKERNRILDLYCGTGTIGIYVSDLAKEIIGIDYNESNIKDAFQNKELNNISNINFICDKVENKIDLFSNIDCIIVDPPRAGLDEKTKKYLKQIASEEIIYVSCDPVTLARDIKDLEDTYQLQSIKIYNMFPRTYHCESVCLLSQIKL